MSEKIEVGQLYKVVTDMFTTTGRHNKIKRPVILKKGEIIEIRFPYEWHFRTECGEYFHATSDTITENCNLLGKIYNAVRFANIAGLRDIFRLQLYNKTNSSPLCGDK